MVSTIRKAMVSSLLTKAGSTVSMGATQKESPVWMPTGSMFSMKQTETIRFFSSRTTSTSNSSHPRIDSSIRS